MIRSLQELFSRNNQAVRPVGYFFRSDPKLKGLKWGNWGSRPYEYYWAANIVSPAGKRIIDLGVGLPSQHNWYLYASKRLLPSYYVGIDIDERIKSEELSGDNYEVRWMDMTRLELDSKSFDIAYCISVMEHLTVDQLRRACAETHRVLSDDGILVVTLDEVWDITGNDWDWNVLEKDLIQQGHYRRTEIGFGLRDFLPLIEDYFVPDTEINATRLNADPRILHTKHWNSCVSYVLLRKRLR